MARHVIIGAGLGGLYTANRLINRGVNPDNIVIIDPRAGSYTRPGHLNCESFAAVNHYTGINTGHSAAHHIKELERAMYNELIAKGVHFVHESFIELQSQTDSQVKAVITHKEDDSQGVYPADFVFDCTGKDALVAAAVNRHQQSLGADIFFKSTSLVDINPIPDHLVAQVIVPEYDSLVDFLSIQDTLQVAPLHSRRKTDQESIVVREQLRSLGWTYEAFPTFYKYPQRTTNKVCLYMETPPDLPKEKQQAWIKLILNIHSNGRVNDYVELKPSRKYGEKPRIMGFKSTPHLLSNVVFQADDLPVVFVGFDALKGFDYRNAEGVSSGIRCCELLLNHIDISGGNIQDFDSKAIEQDLFTYINKTYKVAMVTLLNSRKKAIENGNAYFSDIYVTASLVLDEQSETERAKKQRYQLIAGELAYQAAISQFSTLESRDRSAVESLKALRNCLNLLLKARNRMPASNTLAHHDVNTKLQSVINDLRLEIAAFNIEQVVADGDISPAQVMPVIQLIKQNFEQLDGTFSTRLIQRKISEIIERINHLETSSFFRSGVSQVSVGNTSSLLPFLLSGLADRSSFSGSSPFFAPSSLSRERQRLKTNLTLLSIFLSGLSNSDNGRDPDDSISPSFS